MAEDGPAAEFGDLVLYDRESGSIVALVPFDQLFDPAGFPFHFDQP